MSLTEEEFTNASESAKSWLIYEVLIEVRDRLRKIQEVQMERF